MAEEKRRFPTEVVDLPSKGLLYPKDSPLAGGTIELKYMTAKEEDILTSRNLIQKGVVLDKLLESVIVDEKVSLNDLLLGDKNAIMIATRVLGYGKDYTVQLTDPSTGDKQEETFDLTEIDDKKINTKLFKDGKNEFDYTLPASKTTDMTLTTAGDILYASANNTPARLAKGSALQVLQMNSGGTAPEWATASGVSSGFVIAMSIAL